MLFLKYWYIIYLCKQGLRHFIWIKSITNYKSFETLHSKKKEQNEINYASGANNTFVREGGWGEFYLKGLGCGVQGGKPFCRIIYQNKCWFIFLNGQTFIKDGLQSSSMVMLEPCHCEGGAKYAEGGERNSVRPPPLVTSLNLLMVLSFVIFSFV